MPPKASTPLSVIIVGGGIGGLAASITLAQSGHRVVVLERRDADYEGRSAGGIALTYNSTRWFERMGLKDELDGIADRAYPTRMKYDTLEVIARDETGHPYQMVHRADFSRILAEHALDSGVTIRFLTKIASIQDSGEHVLVRLEDQSVLRSDILIGADGISSQVRHTFLPDISPHLTPCTVILVNIPQSVMESDPGTAELCNMPPFHTPWGPGRSIVSWTMSRRHVYHLQICDYEYETGESYSLYDPPDAPYITEVDDPAFLRALQKHWADFAAPIQFICKSATSCTKWKIAELPPLPSYASPSRRIVLIGDAAHAIKPFAGQGANMAIEDGQVLSTLLSQISSKQEIGHAMSIYDKVRIPRLAVLRNIIESNVKMFGLKDVELRRVRDQQLNESADGREEIEEIEEKYAARAEELRKYGTRATRDWIFEYDAEAEALKAWAEFQSGQTVEAKI